MIPVVEWSPEQPCERLETIRSRIEGPSEAVFEEVSRIIERVRRDGDQALVELTAEFDGVEITPDQIRVDRNQLEALAARLDPKLLTALDRAATPVGVQEQLMGRTTSHKGKRGKNFCTVESISVL